MPLMVREEAAVLFIHIPKCGGSSFEEYMQDRGWRELLSIRGVHANQLRFLCCSPQHMHADLLNRMIRPELINKVVALVREPLSRLRSEYAWQLFQGITDLSPERWIEHVFVEFSKDPFVYDNHIRPQNEFLLPNTIIFKLEEDGVNQALNAVSPLTKKRTIYSSLFAKNPSPKKLKSTNKSPETLEAFDMQKQRIYEFYQKDYERLGYSIP